MAKKTHVQPGDGSARRGGPRPAPPARPAAGRTTSGEATYFHGSGDPQGIKGSFPIDATATVPLQGRSAPATRPPGRRCPAAG